VSYGTAIIEQYLRSYGQAVGRAVLDGPIALEVPWIARVQAVGKAQSEGASALVRTCATERCKAAGNATTGLTYEGLRRVLVERAPAIGGGNAKLTGTIIDQATLLALRSESYWAPWVAAVDSALGGDGTDLWALGEKEYFDLDRAVFYRSICSDINLPPTFEAFGAPQDQLLWAYTSALAPCSGYPHTPFAVAPDRPSAEVLVLASPKDPLTPSTLLDSAPELRALGTVCETDVVGHTSLRDPKFGPLALSFLTGTAEAAC
jgi:pimeloyl-ACP methyl ester carboxylesterase